MAKLDELPDELLMQIFIFLFGEHFEKHHSFTAIDNELFANNEMENRGTKWQKWKHTSVDYFDLADLIIPLCGVNRRMRELIRQSDDFLIFWRRYFGQSLDMMKFLVNAPKRISIPTSRTPSRMGISYLEWIVNGGFSNLTDFSRAKKKKIDYFYSIEVDLLKIFCQLFYDVFGERIALEIQSLTICHANLEKLNEILLLIQERFPNISELSVVNPDTFKKNQKLHEFEISAEITLHNLINFKCPSLNMGNLPPRFKNQLKQVILHESLDNMNEFDNLETIGVYSFGELSKFSKNWTRKFDSLMEKVSMEKLAILSAISANSDCVAYAFSKNYFCNLKELYLTYCHMNIVIDSNISLPNLEILCSSGTITFDGASLPKLWRMGSYSSLSTFVITERQKKLLSLREVTGYISNLHDCDFFSTPNLEKLAIYSDTWPITLTGLKNLKAISCVACPSITIDCCPSLEYLNTERNVHNLIIKNQKNIEFISNGLYSETASVQIDCDECGTLEIYTTSIVTQFNVKHISKFIIIGDFSGTISLIGKVGNTTVDDLQLHIWEGESTFSQNLISLIQEFKHVGRVTIVRSSNFTLSTEAIFESADINQISQFLTSSLFNESGICELPQSQKVTLHLRGNHLQLSKCENLESLISENGFKNLICIDLNSLQNLRKLYLDCVSLCNNSYMNTIHNDPNIPSGNYNVPDNCTEIIDLVLLPQIEKVRISNCSLLKLKAENITLKKLKQFVISGNERVQLNVNNLHLPQIQSLVLYNNPIIEQASTFNIIPGNHLIFKLVQTIPSILSTNNDLIVNNFN